MESASPTPGAADEQLRAARQAHDLAARRALVPGGLILAASVFCGAQTIAPAYRGPGSVVTIAALVWFVAELVRLSAHNGWRPLRSWPKPRWSAAEVVLICIAVLVGGIVGPHLLAGRGNSPA